MRRFAATSPSGRPRISARPDDGKHELHQQLERGRLARAVGSEEAEDLARFDVEATGVSSARYGRLRQNPTA